MATVTFMNDHNAVVAESNMEFLPRVGDNIQLVNLATKRAITYRVTSITHSMAPLVEGATAHASTATLVGVSYVS